jgi:hypothetical protein
MSAELKVRYLAMSDRQRLLFLARLSYELTIHGRAFGLDLAGNEQVEAYKGLNELQHQISQHIAHLGEDSKRYPEDVLWEILDETAARYGLAAHLKQSLNAVLSRSSSGLQNQVDQLL